MRTAAIPIAPLIFASAFAMAATFKFVDMTAAAQLVAGPLFAAVHGSGDTFVVRRSLIVSPRRKS